MATQLLVKNNTVIAHGEDCFENLGSGIILRTDTEEIIVGANDITVVECTKELPQDMDFFDYDYLAGNFMCTGSKENIFHTTYRGNGTASTGVICGFAPKFAIVSTQHADSQGNERSMLFLSPVMGGVWINLYHDGSYNSLAGRPNEVTMLSDGIQWSGEDAQVAMNISGNTYSVILFG